MHIGALVFWKGGSMTEKRINRVEEILLVIRSGKSDDEIL